MNSEVATEHQIQENQTTRHLPANFWLYKLFFGRSANVQIGDKTWCTHY